MTSDEIIEFLREIPYEGNDRYNNDKRKLITSRYGDIKIIDYRSDEGDHDEYIVVIHFLDHDIYLKTDGSYSSYNGDDYYDDWYEVRPVEITKTIYKLANLAH